MTETDPQAAPTVSLDDARDMFDEAFNYLRIGQSGVQGAAGQFQRGMVVLRMLQEHRGWRVLGYESHGALVLAGVAQHLKNILTPESRQQLAVLIRVQGQALVRDIADAVGVSHVTIVRDLREARERGDLDANDEPRMPKNGSGIPLQQGTAYVPQQGNAPVQEAPSRPPLTAKSAARPKAKPRADLYKTWSRHAFELARRARLLDDMRQDDRYPRRVEDLRLTRGDLVAAKNILEQIIKDFEITEE